MLTSRTTKVNIALFVEAFLLSIILVGAWSTTGLSDFYAGSVFNGVLNHVQDMNQYAYLADALIHGRVYLDIPVADGLLNASNPYDYSLRYELGANGEQIYWDYAYFEGKYYCYFGVIPALLLYVPYQLITATSLNTSYACIILAVLAVVAMAYFTKKLGNAFFSSLIGGFGLCIALLLIFFGSNLIYLVAIPSFYSVPYLSSLFFTFLGLGLWLSAKGSGNHSRLSAWRLFLGSLFMAMNLGCRPHFMLACFLAIPIFWDEISKKRSLFSRKGLKSTFWALVPFVMVIVPFLGYNYVRFGSPFDLGSSYNLTGYDMAAYGQDPLTTLYLAYQYLIQPMNFTETFPFIGEVSLRWPAEALHDNLLMGLWYLVPAVIVVLCVLFLIFRGVVRARVSLKVVSLGIIVLGCAPIVWSFVSLANADPADLMSSAKEALFGFAPREPYYGGYLWLIPSSLILLFSPRAYRFLRRWQPSACGVMACCFVFAGIVLLVDAHLCGLTMRYWADFGWYLAVVGAMVFMSVVGGTSKAQLKRRRAFEILVIVLLLATLVFITAWLFVPERYSSVAGINPELWMLISGM